MSDTTAYGAPPSYAGRPPGAGMAITALVLGILALVLSWTVVGGLLLGIVAVVLGLIAAGRAKRGTATGRGMAITGIVLGVLGFLLSVVLVVVGVSLFNSSGGKSLTQCLRDANNDQAKVQKCQQDFKRNLQDKGN